ncbi:MAG: hypothetical protein P4L39_07485 [Humidesulfovibrio sp.]|nr:hypothetical protein [Humidesulfovibrio sp.]
MHPTLLEIQAELDKVIAQIPGVVPNNEPLGIVHGWNLPELTRSELIESAQEIRDLITEQGSDDAGGNNAQIKDYVRRLMFLQQQTIPQFWSTNAAQAVPAYLFTLAGLRKALVPVLTRDAHAEAAANLRKMIPRIRAMEGRLNDLEPRTTSLATMVEQIEQAHSTADQLPTDLESLSEARKKIAKLVKASTDDQVHINGIHEQAEAFNKQLEQYAKDAESVLQRSETAYSAATSVGLAAAFSERSNRLSMSMWVWVGGLVGALMSGGYFGSKQLQTLSELIKAPDASASVIVPNLLLAMLSVGAPVWFAWLATKQIGERFRLAEDYAFKASISRAYEGFRREAARVDKDLEARLLASALTRLDEQPLRLVETTYHGSPWHELAASDVFKQAMAVVPGFTQLIKEFASNTLSNLMQTKTKTASPPKTVSPPKATSEE